MLHHVGSWRWLAVAALLLVERALADATPVRFEDQWSQVALDAATAHPAVRAVVARATAQQAMAEGAGALDDVMIDAAIAPWSLGRVAGWTTAPIGAEVMVSQQLPLSARLAHARRAARSEAKMASAEAEAEALNAARNARTLLCNVWAASMTHEAHLSHITTLRALKDNAAQRLAAGAASLEDAWRVDELLAMEEAEALRTAAEHDSARIALMVATGKDPQQPFVVAETLAFSAGGSELQEPPAPHTTPEVHAAQAAQARAAAAVDLAQAAWIPDVRLSARYSSMWPMPEHQVMLGVGLALPTQTAPRDAERRAANANADAAAWMMQARQRESDANIFTARVRRDAARAMYHHHNERQALLAERMRSLAASTSTAQRTLADVLMADDNVTRVRLLTIDAQREWCMAEAELRFALAEPINGPDTNKATP